MISPLDRIMIAADIKAHPRTVARVYEGHGNEYSRRRVTEAAQRRGLPLPPDPSTLSSENSPSESPTPPRAA
jgi:hypothetical protein